MIVSKFYFYRPQRSWAKVIFLQACVCPQWGEGCLPQCMLGCPPPRTRHPPGVRTLLEQTPPGAEPPLGADPPDQAPPPPGSRLQHTVNERPVRILLECILVKIFFGISVFLIFCACLGFLDKRSVSRI